MRDSLGRTWQGARRRRTSAAKGAAVVAIIIGGALLFGGCGWLLEGFSASPSGGEAPLTVQFSPHNAVRVTKWFWDFGDGATSNSRNPSHTYTASGRYTVSLTITYVTATYEAAVYTATETDCVVVEGTSGRSRVVQFVDARGEEVPYYTENQSVYVRVNDPSRAGDTIVTGALTVGCYRTNAYDLTQIPGAEAGSFLTRPISASELGIALTSTNPFAGMIAIYSDPPGWEHADGVAIIASWSPVPFPPVLESPGVRTRPGEEISTLTPLLQWSASSAGPLPDRYSLSIGAYRSDGSGPDLVWSIPEVTGTSQRVPQGVLSGGKEYQWSVQPANSAGWGPSARSLYFTTRAGLP